MHPVLRLATIAAIAFATLAPASASAATATLALDPPKLAVEARQTGQTGCWAAECGAPPVPIKLVDPVCYAHEGSQYVPQCQDIYP